MIATAGGGDEDIEGNKTGHTTEESLMGVILMMAGAFVQALQFVFEEHVMTMDVPAPPLLLIGMEGKIVNFILGFNHLMCPRFQIFVFLAQ